MKQISGTVEFESGDAVEAGFMGRKFRKAAINSIPCVFAKSGACQLVKGKSLCESKKYVWEEIPEEAPSRIVEPIARCHCCGHYSVSLSTVHCSGGVTEKWCPKCLEGRTQACGKCGRIHIKSALRQVSGVPEGELWCAECCSAHTEMCPVCDGLSVRGSCTHEVIGDTRGRTVKVCQRCYEHETSVCPDCGKRVLNAAAVSVDGTCYCHTCFSRLTGVSSCSNCGQHTRRPVNRSAGRVFCAECSAAGCGSPIYGYHGWDRRPTFWNGGKSTAEGEPDVLYLGFELEAGGAEAAECVCAANAVHEIDPDEKRFHLERDSSIPNHGFELISCPHTLKAHQAYDWDAVLKLMVSNGLRSHDLGGKCGLHVHVSRRFLTSDDCAKIDLFVSRNQTFLERVSRRPSGRYTTYVKKETIEEAGRAGSDSVGRYAAVNFTNSRTVEFRMFRGSLRYETLRGILELVDGMCRWVKTRTCRQIVDNDGEVHNFVAWLKERPADYGFASAYVERRNADVSDGEL